MTDSERLIILAMIKRKMASIKTKKQALTHLQHVGIVTNTGRLTTHYKAPIKKAKVLKCIPKETA